mmetsp:Transcript_32505/g.76365  ORF Transcript_32505/g.76365 Transcript_32505/m.76365 type:complete len:324 (+) Transcript_32505:265-1236(+)
MGLSAPRHRHHLLRRPLALWGSRVIRPPEGIGNVPIGMVHPNQKRLWLLAHLRHLRLCLHMLALAATRKLEQSRRRGGSVPPRGITAMMHTPGIRRLTSEAMTATRILGHPRAAAESHRQLGIPQPHPRQDLWHGLLHRRPRKESGRPLPEVPVDLLLGMLANWTPTMTGGKRNERMTLMRWILMTMLRLPCQLIPWQTMLMTFLPRQMKRIPSRMQMMTTGAIGRIGKRTRIRTLDRQTRGDGRGGRAILDGKIGTRIEDLVATREDGVAGSGRESRVSGSQNGSATSATRTVSGKTGMKSTWLRTTYLARSQIATSLALSM